MLLHTIKYLAMGISGENVERWTTTVARKHLKSQNHEKIRQKIMGVLLRLTKIINTQKLLLMLV
jgi:hypothetical protein